QRRLPGVPRRQSYAWQRVSLNRLRAPFPEWGAELALQRLAGGIARKLVEEEHPVDALVLRGDARIDPFAQFVFAHAALLAEHDGCDRCLAPFVVRDAEDGTFADRRMARGDFLDVLRIHLDAAGVDHVLLAVDEIEE